jgi:hypothetical protein
MPEPAVRMNKAVTCMGLQASGLYAEAIRRRLYACIRRSGSPHPAQDELGSIPKMAWTVTVRIHCHHDRGLRFLLAFGREVGRCDARQGVPCGCECVKVKAQRLPFHARLDAHRRQLLPNRQCDSRHPSAMPTLPVPGQCLWGIPSHALARRAAPSCAQKRSAEGDQLSLSLTYCPLS